MKKGILLLSFILFVIAIFSSEIIEDYLTDSNWTVTDQYKDGEFEGQLSYNIIETISLEEGLHRNILTKYQNGEPITAVEREEIYEYFQTELLNEDKKTELEKVASFMDEENVGKIDKLTERLNEKVITSDFALEEEMMLVEAYLFLGTTTPTETGIEYEVRDKLRTYSMLLKNYHTYIVENNSVIKVDELEYVRNKDDMPGHSLESKFMSEPYGGNGTFTKLNEHGPMEEVAIKNKDDFREWFFFSSGYPVFESISGTSTTVTYIVGSNAANKVWGNEAYQTYDAKTIRGKEQLERKIKIEENLIIASSLGLEIGISKVNSERDINIQLYPSEGTIMILERWQALHEADSKIPFSEEAVNEQNWHEIDEEIDEVKRVFGREVGEFIRGGI